MNRQIRLNQDLLNGKSGEDRAELELYDHCAQLLSALADPNRLMIVSVLLKGPASVSDIAEGIGGEISNVSHHLRILKTAGLVLAKRKAKLQIHSLKPEFVVRGKGTAPNRLEFGCCVVALPK